EEGVRRAAEDRRSGRSAHRRRRRLLSDQGPHRLDLVLERAGLEARRAAALAQHAHHHRHANALRENRRHHARRTIMSRDRALAYAAFAIVCTVWGTTYLAIRIAVETIPPMLLT